MRSDPQALALILLLLGVAICSAPIQSAPAGSILTKCEQQCSEDIICLKQCKKQRQKTIVVYISICLGFLLFWVFCCCCCFVSSHHKFRKFRLLFNSRFKQLKNAHQVDRNVMSYKQFAQHSNVIVKLINMSTVHQNFVQNTETTTPRVEKARVTSVKPAGQFLHQIELMGQDEDGDWSASGAIVCTTNGVICWFFKEYDDDFTRKKIDRIGKFAYISKPSTLAQLQGQFLQYRREDLAKKGEWMLKLPQVEKQKNQDSNLQIMQ